MAMTNFKDKIIFYGVFAKFSPGKEIGMNKISIYTRLLAFLLCLALVLPCIPAGAFAIPAPVDSYSNFGSFAGKTLSVLGDSISTYANASSGTAANTTNSTIGSNAVYYTEGNSYGVTLADTWWTQVAEAMGMRLLVNNAWSGSCVFNTRSGTPGAYIDRCVQLHDDTGSNAGEEPDIIAIYLGTNDVDKTPDVIGTLSGVNYTKVQASGFTPTTVLQAYALMLYKSMKRYPDAEFYCFTLLPEKYGQTAEQLEQMERFNAAIKSIAAHYGAYLVDLYNDSGIIAESLSLNHYLANNLHPNAGGMDAIANCLISSMLKNSKYSNKNKVHSVSYDLDHVIADGGNVGAAVAGKTFNLYLIPKDGFSVDATITMGGVDITQDCFDGSVVSIANPTGDIKITARAVVGEHIPKTYRWELSGGTPVTSSRNASEYNYITQLSGSYESSQFTSSQFSLENSIVLKHDAPWVVEWKSSGTWGAGALMLASDSDGTADGSMYLYRRKESTLIALGYHNGTDYCNYGLQLSDYDIDGSATHTYRLVNKIAADGSNMAFLQVDGVELGAMNNYHIGGTSQGKTSNWVSGKDFVFHYFGTEGHPINSCNLSYIQVWEQGIPQEIGGHIYRWESQKDAFVTTDFAENPLTMQAGSISDGVFSGAYFTPETPIFLRHDRP